MDEIPETSHNIGIVVSRLLDQAKLLFGDRVSPPLSLHCINSTDHSQNTLSH